MKYEFTPHMCGESGTLSLCQRVHAPPNTWGKNSGNELGGLLQMRGTPYAWRNRTTTNLGSNKSRVTPIRVEKAVLCYSANGFTPPTRVEKSAFC